MNKRTLAIPDCKNQEPPRKWRFGSLLDDAAIKEMTEINDALERSSNCQRLIVGYSPPHDDEARVIPPHEYMPVLDCQ